MTLTEWAAFQRGIVAGTIAGKVAIEMLRRMAQSWTVSLQNERGVTKGTIEIRCKVEVDDLAKVEAEK